MRSIMLAGLAGTLIALPVAAQDREERPFAGPYVGGSLGYSFQPSDRGEGLLFDRTLGGNFNQTVTTATGANAFSPGFCNGTATSTANTACRNDRDGIDYYGRVGYDLQRGPIVVGAVGEFGKARVRDAVSGFSTTPAYYTLTRSVQYEASIRGRAGYAFDRTLFYGTGGGGYLKVRNRFTSSNTANAFTPRGDDTIFGVVGGGGVEQKITPNLSFGVEYMFHRYKDDDYRVRVTQGSAPATNPFVLAPNTAGTDLRRNFNYFRWHSIRGTVAYRF